jgi:hypothetical protein
LIANVSAYLFDEDLATVVNVGLPAARPEDEFLWAGCIPGGRRGVIL